MSTYPRHAPPCGPARRFRLRVLPPLLLALSSITFFAAPPGDRAAAGADPPSTRSGRSFILGIAVCVPYLAPPAPSCCGNGARGLVRSLAGALEADPANVRLLVNDQAGYAEVVEGLRWLADAATADDTVVVYYFGHGMLLPDPQERESDGLNEVLTLWTEERPFCILQAVLARQWLLDDDLGRMLDRIPARRKLFIADTCHGAAAQRGVFSGSARSTTIPRAPC